MSEPIDQTFLALLGECLAKVVAFPKSRGSRIPSSLDLRISVCLLDCVGWQGPLRSVKYFRKLVPRRRESLWHLRCTKTESRARFLQASAIARNQPGAWLFDWPQYR